MKPSALPITLIAMSSLLIGCQSTSKKEVVAVEYNNYEIMSNCSLPDSTEAGPIKDTLFVVGTFSDWKHIPDREYKYKGDNLYQAVTQESAGKYKMQFASSSWSPQFTADERSMTIGQEKALKFGGYAKDTEVEILEPGQYVWSMKFDDTGAPFSVMVEKCQ
ncbi:glycosidase [Vibrio agarivorans]|uniref:glycosidase n=1 Tax=Vibrio agarivorans TaxID=153622 RepID=UPI002230AB07|nr:glycosidase [Vibrio agarivorans]MDN3662934.1 glycosidase [Vibrio agarivorans]